MSTLSKRKEQLVSTKPRCVVGIGASAGGLEALQQLLTNLSDDTGMAFVIIQHLSPDHPSLMPDILSKYTTMPVTQAGDDTAVQKNCVYLITPGYDITIAENGVVHLKKYDRSVLNHPVDIFLRSLAENYGKTAIAVILSGTGSDGTNGIREINERGGLIFVQDPKSSKFDGMPRSAIATGFVDLILDAEEIGRELGHMALLLTDTAELVDCADPEPIKQILQILKAKTNVNFTFYKRPTILRGIERRMVVLHKNDIDDYISYLGSNSEEVTKLSKSLLIGVTSFFRDPAFFETLKEEAIYTILRNTDADTQIRVWVAGCSTGEEAYSISILFAEAMEELRLRRKLKIFATDLDQDAINLASKGVYGENIIDNVTLARLSRFFTKKGSKYVVNQEIRRPIIFAQHNVFQDPPFGRLDLISCRNMMIYFQPVLQSELFNIFNIALNTRGYLFLGSSEAPSGYENVFQSQCHNERIFIRHASGKVPAARTGGIFDLSSRMALTAGERMSDGFGLTAEEDYDESRYLLNELEQIMPPTLLINEKNELSHTFGDCSPFLSIQPGSATFDIFSLLREEFCIGVSTALKAARENGKRVCYEKMPAKLGEELHFFDLTATPILDRHRRATEQVAVTIAEQGASTTSGAVPFDIDAVSAQHIADLEKELKDTRIHLKISTDELEAANANLQAANEELLTANEELLSSNEELQSVNEELYAVNAQYQEKANELAIVNNDVLKFLSSTLVGIMFVDEKLNIRNFTHFIAEQFCLAEQDIGRSLRYLASNFTQVDLVWQCEEVLNTGEERDLEAAAGNKYYLIRIAPFEEESGQDKTLIVTIVDTTKQHSDQKQIRDIQNELKAEVARGEEKNSFLSRISHDMRTPMNTIYGLLELTLSEECLTHNVRDNLEKMQDSSRYLITVIDDVLDTSRIRNGKVVPNIAPVAESDITKPLLPMLRKSAEDKGIEFRYHVFDCEDIAVMADAPRVERIIANLISNSVKFTPAGGCISLNVSCQYTESKAFHTYFISDTGCGISDDFQQRMFEPFEQGGSDKTAEMKGTGLGLYICKQFTELLGGSIRCESTVGEGTTFVVKLAFDKASPEQVKQSEDAMIRFDPARLEGKRVLLCEDHPVNAKICEKLLEKQSISCETAENGMRGLEMFSASTPFYYDAVLMDMRMPVMGGIEATRAIRASEREDAKAIPIIAISADAQDEQKESGYAAGITDYLTKPVEAGRLYAALSRL